MPAATRSRAALHPSTAARRECGIGDLDELEGAVDRCRATQGFLSGIASAAAA
jgi:hypothetical protein